MTTERRYESLRGALSRRQADEGAQAAPAPAEAAETSGAPRVARPEPAGERTSPRGVRRSAGQGPARISFQLPVELRDRLRARVRVDGSSQPNVLLDAVEAACVASEGVRDYLGATAVPVGGTYFPRPRPVASTVDRVTVAMQLPEGAVPMLDELVVRFGAESRTELIVASLDFYLD